MTDAYPVTITMSRYGGTYERGRWVAWPLDPDRLPQGWDDEDMPCRQFWQSYTGPVGGGDTPQEALDDLIKQTGSNW